MKISTSLSISYSIADEYYNTGVVAGFFTCTCTCTCGVVANAV